MFPSSLHNFPLILVSEITELDPYCRGLISGDEHPGPLLALVASKRFDKLLLVVDENESRSVSGLENELAAKFPSMGVEVERVPFSTALTSERMDELLRNIVEKIRAVHHNCDIHVALNRKNPETLVAWVKQTKRFDGITLLIVRQNLHASTEPPEIEVIGESHARNAPATTLLEPHEPTAEEIAKELDLVGSHPSFRQLLHQAWSLAKYDVPVLITGEKGSGKTSLATFLWKASPRAPRPLQTADPVDLPDPLTAMLLFGASTTPGGFTAPTGKIAASANGTLLIENVEKLSTEIQNSLAEFLATKKYLPAGAAQSVTSTARLIFTSGDVSPDGPAKLIPSLKAHLQSTVLRLPSLCERRDDIPQIALHYLRHINLSLKSSRSMSKETLRAIQTYPWRGNVRELRLAVEKAALLSSGRDLLIETEIPGDKSSGGPFRSSTVPIPEIDENFSMELYLGEVRKKLLMRALDIAKGNQSEAARLLRITPQAVHQFLKIQNKIRQGLK
jgi:DNA-binding NtrC family response regulator